MSSPNPVVQGVREHEDHVALYYALRRHADGMFNAKTGRYDGISSAYRMKLVPAFVVDPDKPMEIPNREARRGRKKAFDDTIRGHDQGPEYPRSAGGAAHQRRTDSSGRR